MRAIAGSLVAVERKIVQAFKQGGLGVPLVAARIYYGVTAVIRFVGRRRVVSFEDGSSASWC